MDEIWILTGFLALGGTVLIVGPLWMMARYHHHMNHMSASDLIDDEARKEGTALFITGGVVFWIAALVLALLHWLNKV